MAMSKNIDPVTFEILKIAKELVINEYTDRRAEQHNKWLVESEHLWRTQRLRLAYPTIPPYPTEEDIIARAALMLEFVKRRDVEPEIVNNDIVDTEVVDNDIELKLEQSVVEEPTTDTQDITDVVEKETPPETKSSKRILPTVLDKLDEMRKSFRA
jgi:hypothetical protein